MVAVPVIEMTWVPMVSHIVVSGWPETVEAHEGISAMIKGIYTSAPVVVAPIVRNIETVPWPDHTVA